MDEEYYDDIVAPDSEDEAFPVLDDSDSGGEELSNYFVKDEKKAQDKQLNEFLSDLRNSRTASPPTSLQNSAKANASSNGNFPSGNFSSLSGPASSSMAGTLRSSYSGSVRALTQSGKRSINGKDLLSVKVMYRGPNQNVDQFIIFKTTFGASPYDLFDHLKHHTQWNLSGKYLVESVVNNISPRCFHDHTGLKRTTWLHLKFLERTVSFRVMEEARLYSHWTVLNISYCPFFEMWRSIVERVFPNEPLSLSQSFNANQGYRAQRLEESMREEDVLETTTQKTRFRLSTLPQYCALYSILNFDYGTALTYLMQVIDYELQSSEFQGKDQLIDREVWIQMFIMCLLILLGETDNEEEEWNLVKIEPLELFMLLPISYQVKIVMSYLPDITEEDAAEYLKNFSFASRQAENSLTNLQAVAIEINDYKSSNFFLDNFFMMLENFFCRKIDNFCNILKNILESSNISEIVRQMTMIVLLNQKMKDGDDQTVKMEFEFCKSHFELFTSTTANQEELDEASALETRLFQKLIRHVKQHIPKKYKCKIGKHIISHETNIDDIINSLITFMDDDEQLEVFEVFAQRIEELGLFHCLLAKHYVAVFGHYEFKVNCVQLMSRLIEYASCSPNLLGFSTCRLEEFQIVDFEGRYTTVPDVNYIEVEKGLNTEGYFQRFKFDDNQQYLRICGFNTLSRRAVIPVDDRKQFLKSIYIALALTSSVRILSLEMLTQKQVMFLKGALMINTSIETITFKNCKFVDDSFMEFFSGVLAANTQLKFIRIQDPSFPIPPDVLEHVASAVVSTRHSHLAEFSFVSRPGVRRVPEPLQRCLAWNRLRTLDPWPYLAHYSLIKQALAARLNNDVVRVVFKQSMQLFVEEMANDLAMDAIVNETVHNRMQHLYKVVTKEIERLDVTYPQTRKATNDNANGVNANNNNNAQGNNNNANANANGEDAYKARLMRDYLAEFENDYLEVLHGDLLTSTKVLKDGKEELKIVPKADLSEVYMKRAQIVMKSAESARANYAKAEEQWNREKSEWRKKHEARFELHGTKSKHEKKQSKKEAKVAEKEKAKESKEMEKEGKRETGKATTNNNNSISNNNAGLNASQGKKEVKYFFEDLDSDAKLSNGKEKEKGRPLSFLSKFDAREDAKARANEKKLERKDKKLPAFGGKSISASNNSPAAKELKRKNDSGSEYAMSHLSDYVADEDFDPSLLGWTSYEKDADQSLQFDIEDEDAEIERLYWKSLDQDLYDDDMVLDSLKASCETGYKPNATGELRLRNHFEVNNLIDRAKQHQQQNNQADAQPNGNGNNSANSNNNSGKGNGLKSIYDYYG